MSRNNPLKAVLAALCLFSLLLSLFALPFPVLADEDGSSSNEAESGSTDNNPRHDPAASQQEFVSDHVIPEYSEVQTFTPDTTAPSYMLIKGRDFDDYLMLVNWTDNHSLITDIYFDRYKPTGSDNWEILNRTYAAEGVFVDVSARQDKTVLAYLKNNELHIVPASDSQKIIFNYDCAYMFDFAGDRFPDLKNIYFDWIDTSQTTSMKGMFNCGTEEELDVSNFDTGSVTDMTSMFYNMPNIRSLNLSSFDTSNVTSMKYMFDGAEQMTYLDVSSFNTSKVQDFSFAFRYLSSLESLDLSNFDTSAAINLGLMCSVCPKMKSLNVSSFRLNNAEDISGMFSGDTSLTSLDLANWGVTNKCWNFGTLFYNCSSLESLDLTSWDTSGAEYVDHMFFGNTSLTSLDTSNFRADKVKDAASMFEGCTGLNELDLKSFNPAVIENTSSMFENCTNLSVIYANAWASSAAVTSTDMFAGDVKLPDFNASEVDFSKAKPYPEGYFAGYVTITLDPNGGSFDGDTASRTLSYLYGTGQPAEGGTYSIPSKPGYAFTGWKTASGTAFTFDENGEPVNAKGEPMKLDSDIDLSAQWKLADGTIVVNKIWLDTMTDDQRNIPANIPIITITTTAPDYTPYTYTLTFDANGGYFTAPN